MGETARTIWERGAEHIQDALGAQDKVSHIQDHLLSDHPGELEKVVDSFKMAKIKGCVSALNRQVREAVKLIYDKSDQLLNLKSEYKRCLIRVIR